MSAKTIRITLKGPSQPCELLAAGGGRNVLWSLPHSGLEGDLTCLWSHSNALGLETYCLKWLPWEVGMSCAPLPALSWLVPVVWTGGHTCLLTQGVPHLVLGTEIVELA